MHDAVRDRSRAAAIGINVATALYLLRFVDRGWVPHDEGMIGVSAEHVLRGGLPHVAYSESYTGALTWIHAAVFSMAGIDLLHIRWLLFGVALLALGLTYAIARRWLAPVSAAVAAAVALVLSFPNYFAGIPSWWLLVCALAAMYFMLRYGDAGRVSDLVAAGLAAGMAVAIKQTGVYLVVALGLVVLYDGTHREADRRRVSDVALRYALSVAAVGLAVFILAPRVLRAEGAYLFVPAASCALPVCFRRREPSSAPDSWSPLRTLLLLTGALALPLAVLLVPYVGSGHLRELVNGVFVAPRLRLTFASLPMPGWSAFLAGVPITALVVALVYLPGARARKELRVALWSIAGLLPILALVFSLAYQMVWQTLRLLAALLPLAAVVEALWPVAESGDGGRGATIGRGAVFLCGATLAWMALNQFPFAAPIYFCYVVPLAVLTAVAVVSTRSPEPRVVLAPLALLCLLFGVTSMNRTSIYELGQFHQPVDADVPLELPRAHLRVSGTDADIYRRLAHLLNDQLAGRRIFAVPDCPEVYFLAGQADPGGRLFDFLVGDPARVVGRELGERDVVVINHRPAFSKGAPQPWVFKMRYRYAQSELIGRFEVRWQ